MEPSSFANSVFINCPFDEDYYPLLHSIIFSVFACGFNPRSALEEDDSSDIRLDKIVRLIESCKFGIHDISKVELDKVSGLPRFNMPFELGLFWGAKKFGIEQNKEKIALIFEKQKYSYQKYLSDINGVDIKAHNNDPETCIKFIRNWLFTNSRRRTIPSYVSIQKNYKDFVSTRLPVILADSHTQLPELTFNDYCAFVSTSLKAKEKLKK